MFSVLRDSMNNITFQQILALLKGAGVRIKYDSRDNYTAGWKYNHWEQKGVPIRIEVGPRDLEARQIVAVRRDEATKQDIKFDTLLPTITQLLEDIQVHIAVTSIMLTCFQCYILFDSTAHHDFMRLLHVTQALKACVIILLFVFTCML
jgi:Anticodon binding domain